MPCKTSLPSAVVDDGDDTTIIVSSMADLTHRSIMSDFLRVKRLIGSRNQLRLAIRDTDPLLAHQTVSRLSLLPRRR